MITTATTLLVYLWHYLVARLVYDDLLRPMLHGSPSAITLTALAAGIAVALVHVRWRGRRRGS
jgi:hypothetical protein